jgi:phosphatidylglycerophosphatase C
MTTDLQARTDTRGAPTVAAFDFDGTLTEGGSVYPFLIALCGRAKVWRVTARMTAALVKAAIVGGTAADQAKERLFTRLIGGLPLEDVQRTADQFAERHLRQHLRHDTMDRMEWHAAQGHHVVIVSASPELYVRPAGIHLGVDGVVATRLAVGGGGLLTGGYEGKNCRGAEKYARLIGYLRTNGLLSSNGGGGVQPVLWVYGNSRGDLRLLNAADHGVDAGKLGPLGRLRRFPRLAEVSRSRGGIPSGSDGGPGGPGERGGQARPAGQAGDSGVTASPTTRPE